MKLHRTTFDIWMEFAAKMGIFITLFRCSSETFLIELSFECFLIWHISSESCITTSCRPVHILGEFNSFSSIESRTMGVVLIFFSPWLNSDE